MGNMREISIQECNAVFGGNDAIVVSGRRTVPGSTNFSGTYGPVYNTSMLPAGIMGSYEDIYDPDGDDDGGEIVVVGSKDALDAARERAQLQFTLLKYVMGAGIGAAGFSGWLGAASALASIGMENNSKEIFASLVTQYLEQDAADGQMDGRYKFDFNSHNQMP